MMVDTDNLIKTLQHRQANIMNGIVQRGKSIEETEYERGKFAELNQIISILRNEAAENSR